LSETRFKGSIGFRQWQLPLCFQHPWDSQRSGEEFHTYTLQAYLLNTPSWRCYFHRHLHHHRSRIHAIPVCVAGVYLSLLMAETSISVILTIWVLRLHHAGPDETEMSPLTRRVVLCWLARLVGSTTPSVDRSHRARRSDTTGYHSARDKPTSHSPGQTL